jgi:YidC/Oxa1 family membrane protein insertase
MWEWFINLLTQILQFFADICGDWGLAIIILTVIIRLILTPLTIKSTRSSAQMQVLQPRMQEIQLRYADDPQRQQEELRKFYSEHKFNPLGGCLPLLLQMPVFFALFSVLKEGIPDTAHFFGILDSLSQSVSGAVAATGFAGAWVFLLLDVLFGVLTFIPMYLQQKNSTNEAQKSQSMIMGVFMAGLMIWFGWSVPVGVLLYYNTSALWGIVQQVFITNRIIEKYKKQEEERMANMPVQIDVVRKEKNPRQHKKN